MTVKKTPATSLIFAEDIVESRKKRLTRLFRAIGGSDRDGLRAVHDLSGLSISYLVKFRRGEIDNPTVVSIERLDMAMLRLEAQLGIAH